MTRRCRAAELAREVWRDRALAERLERDADELRERFNEAFWTDERGGYYVLALDREKNQVDSLCSNVGHLLWSGIVPNERVDAVVDQMMGDGLWSGWGIRTMSTLDRAYNPLAYHNGTVWPHDNSLCAGGWRDTAAGRGAPDRPPDADRGPALRLSASGGLRGAAADGDTFPDCLPDGPLVRRLGRPGRRCSCSSCCSVSAPTGGRTRSSPVAPPELPAWAGSLRLSSVRAFDRLWEARLEDGQATVQPG